MADPPSMSADDREFISCPYCTIQIPLNALNEPVCPHCRQAISPGGERAAAPDRAKEEEARRPFRIPDRFDSLLVLWDRYGKWITVAAPVLVFLALLYIGYGIWTGHKVRIVPNPTLPITVAQQKGNKSVLLKVTVTNRGEDIPDLSLKSVAVVVEFLYRDGRRDKKTVFPKAEYHGEGALLHGESGSFEIEAGTVGLTEISMRSEVIDLGMGRELIPPGSRP